MEKYQPEGRQLASGLPYCAARDFAERRLSFQPRDSEGDHGRLRAHFRDTGRRQLASLLGELRQRRNQCDYDSVDLANGRETLDDAIACAERIIRACP